MLNFQELLLAAKSGDLKAQERILEILTKTMTSKSFINSKFDEDLYQRLAIAVLRAIMKFNI